jgi:putative ABC transport system permease protein
MSAIEDLLAASVAQPRFNTALLVGLAVCAALLAAVGVYGVVAYSVSRRTAEIGLRMALGADPAGAFQMVVMGALRVVAVGVMLGLGSASIDVVTYVVAGLSLAALGVLAASLPARRASRIDPLVALRRD